GQIKIKADLVRNIDPAAILRLTGATADKSDKNKWHTPRGVISVSGPKFMNWNQGCGGGGAIDLIIHLRRCNFKTAVLWLADNFGFPEIQGFAGINPGSKGTLKLPLRDNKKLSQVIRYLGEERHLPLSLIKALIHTGKLYADRRGNAVFLLLGKEKRIVGAELRGTTKIRWQGLAPGSRKDLGCFYVSGRELINQTLTKIVICESAIDAVSFLALEANCLAASTSGANPNPAWLKMFINKGYEVYCGYDADDAGDNLAKKMIELYPSIRRLRPPRHDWNDVLRANLTIT
ncbi:MAG: DUF3991 and TOPRIM domain-containing protein, partial [Candidatus Omnitrophota bacterium]|nr:DUF3991 and TOPRIM domain-containing protein [Candidatus Omnitrophota bacterium]